MAAPEVRLRNAARTGKVWSLRALTAPGSGVDVNAVDAHGRTALMLAANYRNARTASEMVTVLLSAGADILARQSDGSTVLHGAVWMANYSALEKLLQHARGVAGFDINVADTDHGFTALMVAAQEDRILIARLLIEAGAAVDTVTQRGGHTALHLAVANGGGVLAYYLLAAGARVDAVDHVGRTPLMHAARLNKPSLVALLVYRGASVTKRNAQTGWTALQFAAAACAQKPVYQLLKCHGIHSVVADAVDTIGAGAELDGVAVNEAHAAAVRNKFTAWFAMQQVVEALFAPAGYGDSGVARLSKMEGGLLAAKTAGASADDLSTQRNPGGFTALGAAAAFGASEWTVAQLLKAGCSALVLGNAEGASAGALAGRRAGSGTKLSAQLYRAAAKAAARAQPAFRRVRSELVLFNRVPGGLPQEYLPRDVVDHMLEWCATPREGGWFAESPKTAAGAAPAAVPAAAFGGGAAGAGAEEVGGGGAAGDASRAAKRARGSD